MVTSGFNKSLMVLAIVAGSTMHAIAFDNVILNNKQSAYISAFKQVDKNEKSFCKQEQIKNYK
jgi:hypothetical protein